MPLIVLMEDDAATRLLVESVLKKEGYDVMSAENGLDGLALVRMHRPDVVVSDVQMPLMDGFAMLQALRAEPEFTTLPVILLTSLQDRAHVRAGMTTGADDYITKPFKLQELSDAVNAQLSKRMRLVAMQSMAANRALDLAVEAKVGDAVEAALATQKREISKLYEQRMAHSLSEQWPGDQAPQVDRIDTATVLFIDMCQYATWAERLSSAELAELVQQFYGNAGDTVHLFGASHMQFVGEGMVAVFAAGQDTQSVNHGLRAVRAAFGLLDARRRVQQFAATRFEGRGLPAFDVVIALHSGPVAMARLQGLFGSGGQLTPVGDTVSSAVALHQAALSAQWQIATTVQTGRLVAGAVKIGRRALVPVPGRSQPLDTLELTALATP
jgi:DNA-binding response OmpR family regulator